MKKDKLKLVVFTGAGISAESGLGVFRGADGLWEGYRIEDVASPGGWAADPKMVLEFYNLRRAGLRNAKPNAGHLALVELEDVFDVQVVTQNIDNLHELAGSTNVLHLHGELMQARSTVAPYKVYDLGEKDINLGDVCELGAQLRPNVVWFGEAVPNYEIAFDTVSVADVLLVVGTSLNVYPAAELAYAAPNNALKVIVDPNPINLVKRIPNLREINQSATLGLPSLVKELILQFS